MLVVLPAALAVIGSIDLVVGVVDDIGLIFRGELAIRPEQIWLIHRPLLDWMLVLVTVVMTVGGPSQRVEGVSIRMEVVPGG
jgi:hypothetical protein